MEGNERPFSEFKATELESDRLEALFVEPYHIDKLYSNDVAFIEGARGTGKTTVLRHLCDKYNNVDGKPKKRLGIYYRFDVNKMASFSGSLLSDEDWKILFAHCFSLEMCIEITEIMLKLSDRYSFQHESEICESVSCLFFDGNSTIVQSFSSLKAYLQSLDYCARKYKRNPLVSEAPLYGDCETAFEKYCSMLRRETFFDNLCVHFLLDEYENMLDYQKKYINSCVKNANYNHIYKICVRPNGRETMATLKESEVLTNPDDYKIINYTKEILGENDGMIKSFMVSACNKRLQKYYEQKEIKFELSDIQIENYFPSHISYDTQFELLSKDKAYLKKVIHDVNDVFLKHGLKYTFDWNLIDLKILLVISEKKGFEINSVISSIEKKRQQV